MYHGTTVDELMQMVESAERHASAIAEEERFELETAVVAYRAAEQREALVVA
jgi:hypothetical protein